MHVMVELDAPAAAVIYAEGLKVAQASASADEAAARVPMAAAQKSKLPRVEIDSASAARVSNQVRTLDAAQRSLLSGIANAGGKVIYRTQRAYNGIAVKVSPDRIKDLAKLPGVKTVRPMTKKYQTAFSDIDFLGARSFWTNGFNNGVGVHGEGVTIAIIDSGLDYVHANFGGPGTNPSAQGITDEGPVPNTYFPSNKVPFGTDLAGDNYSASGEPDTSDEPTPDDNPLDSAENGHGTACASLAAGYGENAGRTTYTGDYDNMTPIQSMFISPGFAPNAQLVPVRVFGKTGSTFLTTAAIEYAMDPNGDGDLSDHVDVISMSLGANNGTADDDSAIASANAVSAGVIVTAASGNAGDTHYITSSPAAGIGVISVAASYNDQGGYIADALVLGLSQNVKGERAHGLFANESSPRGPVKGKVVAAVPNTAATTLTNPEQMNGNICFVKRGGGFANTANFCQEAGAIGIIIQNQFPEERPADPEQGGDPRGQNTTGATLEVPDLMVSASDGKRIRDVSQFDETTGEPANPVRVRISPENKIIAREGVSADTMPTYSARGPVLESNALKPDVTAPAEVVGVASSFTGNKVRLFNGTSSATPHVAGSLALLRQQHPNWSVEEIQALMLNTANHDLFKESGTNGSSGPSSTQRGVARAGAGRIDLTAANNGHVVVFNTNEDGRVSVSFGNVEVPSDGSIQLSKEVTIRNKTPKKNAQNEDNPPTTYDVTYQSLSTVGDAAFSAPFSQVTVNAGEEVTFPVVFSATGQTLKHTKDASVSSSQTVAIGSASGNVLRQTLSEVAGYGVFTPTTTTPSVTNGLDVGEPTIRIPLYAAPKQVGSMHTVQKSVTPNNNNTTFHLTLTGTPVFTGVGVPNVVGLLKPFECQFASPLAGDANFSSDPNVLKYVGVTSDYASREAGKKQETVLTFALEGFGDASVPSFISSDKEILIDLNFDGQPDFVLYSDSLRDPSTGNHTNVYFPTLLNLNEGAAQSTLEFTNGFPGGTIDTNIFNNSVVMLSVDAAQLGYTGAGQSNFQYLVATFNRNSGELTDVTPFMKYDIANPGLDGSNGQPEPDGTYYFDLPDNGDVLVKFNGTNFKANESKGILMVHTHNGRADRTELVTLRTPRISNFTPKQGPVGTQVTITGSGFDNSTVVKFSPNKPAQQVIVINQTTISCKVPPGAVTGPITVSNPAGADTSSEDFEVTP